MFSDRKLWPNTVLKCSPNRRKFSPGPPGPVGRITRTGRAGHPSIDVCAVAGIAIIAAALADAPATNERLVIIARLPDGFFSLGHGVQLGATAAPRCRGAGAMFPGVAQRRTGGTAAPTP